MVEEIGGIVDGVDVGDGDGCRCLGEFFFLLSLFLLLLLWTMEQDLNVEGREKEGYD